MNIQEGTGWRLRHDPQRQPYSVLIGGAGWAFELRQSELLTLQQGVSTLLEQYRQILPCLMSEEEIALELDLPLVKPPGVIAGGSSTGAASGCGQLFIALEGDPQGWALRFVLTPADGARAVEGEWSLQASAALAAALDQLSLAASDADMSGLECSDHAM